MAAKFAFTLIAGLGLAAIVWPLNSAQAQPNPLGLTGSGATTASRSLHLEVSARPRKSRYWRHRGGQHPHYGSRRVRNR